MNSDSEVAETGGIPVLGVPAYESESRRPAAAAPALRPPRRDGGFPSGHTNAAWLAAFALPTPSPSGSRNCSPAPPSRRLRIVAGMHSLLDVIGGRVLGTALAAATLHNPINAELKAAAREQALAYFTAATGVSADELPPTRTAKVPTPTGTPTARPTAPPTCRA